MKSNVDQSANGVVLAHWFYGREEWRAFCRNNARRRGWLAWVVWRLAPGPLVNSPEVLITPGMIRINRKDNLFSDVDRLVRTVSINDDGELNVLEIGFEGRPARGVPNGRIRVLVPKGKLREAIALQEMLLPKK